MNNFFFLVEWSKRKKKLFLVFTLKKIPFFYWVHVQESRWNCGSELRWILWPLKPARVVPTRWLPLCFQFFPARALVSSFLRLKGHRFRTRPQLGHQLNHLVYVLIFYFSSLSQYRTSSSILLMCVLEVKKIRIRNQNLIEKSTAEQYKIVFKNSFWNQSWKVKNQSGPQCSLFVFSLMSVESETGSFRDSETRNNLRRILESCSKVRSITSFFCYCYFCFYFQRIWFMWNLFIYV